MMNFINKEKIGWSVFNRHYRLQSPIFTLLTWLADTIGSILFFPIRHNRTTALKNICIVELNHLGDMVIATAFTQAARKIFPEAQITLIVRSMAVKIAEMAAGIDNIVTADTPWFARNDSMGWKKTISFCIKNFRKYDIGFELYGDPRSILLTRFISKYTVGSGIRGFGFMLNCNISRRHIFDKPMHELHLDLLRKAMEKPVNEVPSIKPDPVCLEKVQRMLNSYGIQKHCFTAVHPGVSTKIREWPIENWISLTENLLNHHHVVCADYTGTQASVLAKHFSSRKFHIIKLSLPEFSAFLSFARLVISVESLAGHLAASCDSNVIVINSGTTIAAEMAPGWSSNACILNDTECPLIPCGLDKCPYGYPSGCMKRITVEKVVSSANEILNSCQPESN